MMDILMSETCWAHKKWNKTASDIKLVFYSSTITMMHGPINVRLYRPNKNFMTYNWLHVAQTFLRKQPRSYSKTHYPLCNLKVHWRIHNSEALGHIHKQMNSLHTFAYRYLSIHFIIILSRMFKFPFRICGKECTPFSYLPCMLHATLTLKLTYSS